MQVNFAHNYSKTFFKGSSRSSETKAVPDDQSLTAKEFRNFAEQQMFYNEAMTKALQAILGILQASATPSIDINDLKFKDNEAYTLDGKKFSGVAINTLKNGDTIEHTYVSGRLKQVSRKGKKPFEKKYTYYPEGGGLKEVIAETKYGTNITKSASFKKPGSRVITTEFGVYNGSYSLKDLNTFSIEKLTLNGKDIVETSADGYTTTYTRRDGSVVVVDNKTETTTIDYSNCSNRDKNDPIKEIYKGRSDKILAERHWENGAYEYFDKYGKLTETKIIKNDGCEITFTDGHYGFIVIKETFPPKPEGENTPPTECFAIHPKNVKYDENDKLKTISPNYDRDYAYMRQKIDRLDEAINEIKNYECPLEKIEFYPSGQIKSEHYTFVLYDRSCFFEIKFNENGQVDNVIVTDAWSRVNKEDSSRIKEKLNKAGYKGYTEYASDLQERARIAYSVQKRLKETPQ